MYTSTEGQMTFNAFKAWMLTDEAAIVIEALRDSQRSSSMTCSLLEDWLKKEDSLKRRERITTDCLSIVNADEQMRECRIFAEAIGGSNYRGIGVHYLGISHLKVSWNNGQRRLNVQLDPEYGIERLVFGCLCEDFPDSSPLGDYQESDDKLEVVRRLFRSFLESVSRFRDEPWGDGYQSVKSYSELMLYLESLPCSFGRQIKEERWFVISYTPCDEQLRYLNYLPWAFKTAKRAKRAVEEIAEYIVPRDWDRYKVRISDGMATITRLQGPWADAHTLTQADVEREMEVITLQVEQITVPRNRMIPTLNVPLVWDWKAVQTKNWNTRTFSVTEWLEKLIPTTFQGLGEEQSAESERFARMCDWWKFDFTQLERRQWIFVLRHRPDLAECCQWWNAWDDREWCFLLRRQPQFADRCPWFDEIPADLWSFLLRKQPQFSKKFNRWDEICSYYWVKLLKDQPQFASHCDWGKLGGYDWAALLKDRPEFAPHCPWEKLDGNNWAELLKDRPDFSPHCDWEKLDGNNWVGLLCARPEFSSYCGWEKLHGFNWSDLLKDHAELRSHCDWGKLSGSDWVELLISRPEFADRCVWSELSGDDWERLLVHDPSYIGHCDIGKLELDSLYRLLMARPELVKHILVWERFSEMQRMRLLKKSALFCECVDWEGLSFEKKIDYLLLRPEFQDKMNWSEVTDERDWFRLLSVFPEYRKYASGYEGAESRSYVWIGLSGPIVIIPVHSWIKDFPRYPVDARECAGWYKVTPWGINYNKHRKNDGMRYAEAETVVDKIFSNQTSLAHYAFAIDGVYAGANDQEGVKNFATIMKNWFANNVTSIKILYLECGYYYSDSVLEG